MTFAGSVRELAPYALNHLWQSTLFTVVAALLAWSLRGNSARVRFWVWMAASLKWLLPFSALAALGSEIPWHGAVVAPPASLTVLAQPFPPGGLAAAIPSPRQLPVTHPVTEIVAILWLCGFVAVLGFWVFRWLQVNWAVSRGEAVATLTAWPLRTVITSSRIEPGVFGVFRPTLLLPAGFAERLGPAQMDALVAHELCHVRRRDNLWATIHMLVESAFWFHPFVWWTGWRLVAERALACDEEVMRAGGDPEAYVEGILEVCRYFAGSPLPCVSGVGGGNLKRRIAGIMARPFDRRLKAYKLVLLAALGCAAVAAPVSLGWVSGARRPTNGATPRPVLHVSPVARTEPTAPVVKADAPKSEPKDAAQPSPAPAVAAQGAFTSAGHGKSGAGVEILSDTQGVNFDDYLRRVTDVTYKRWMETMPAAATTGAPGKVVVVFNIMRNGSVPEEELVGKSGTADFDQAAIKTIAGANPFPALPPAFSGASITLQFSFYYNLSPDPAQAAPAPALRGASGAGVPALLQPGPAAALATGLPPRTARREEPAPTFDTVSVKPFVPGGGRGGGFGVGLPSILPAGLHVNAATLLGLVEFAYGVDNESEQLTGLTDWANTDRWTVDARSPAGTPDLTQNPSLAEQMVQQLLADRFHLQIHTETRTIRIYELHLDGDQPKNLKASEHPGEPQMVYRPDRDGNIFAEAMTMPSLARALSSGLDRVVVDKTGWTGIFQFKIPDNVPDGTPGRQAAEIADRGLIRGLGLKLVEAEAPEPVYVVTGFDRPTGN